MKNSAVLKLMLLFAVLTLAAVRPADGLAGQVKHQQGPQSPDALGEIPCPVPEIRAEITTKLPKPWWNTPQIGRFESAEVQVIGGKQTLVCQYHAYATRVSVMRLFPEGTHECRASGNRFTCR
jgi:hypothetical protein